MLPYDFYPSSDQYPLNFPEYPSPCPNPDATPNDHNLCLDSATNIESGIIVKFDLRDNNPFKSDLKKSNSFDISYPTPSSVPGIKDYSSKFPTIPIFYLSELLYYPIPLSKSEPLMYVTLRILGTSIKALVDGGATRSFIGPEGTKAIETLNLLRIATV